MARVSQLLQDQFQNQSGTMLSPEPAAKCPRVQFQVELTCVISSESSTDPSVHTPSQPAPPGPDLAQDSTQTPVKFFDFELFSPAEAIEAEATQTTMPPPPLQTTRSGWAIHPTAKVRDAMPDIPGTQEDRAMITSNRPEPDECSTCQGRHVILLLTQHVKTVANKFGLSHLYKCHPVRKPIEEFNLDMCYALTANATLAAKAKRRVQDIIAPYPNLSS
ncbi:unnamed protein product [Somion occarium]|uniref:Uncharacterized protein n=1 Tax=Somion occarium TaxID=3059160 RepID=A0ABP1E423_9APHY